MAMIAPTVDSVGDAALTNSIIDKSITEIQDELVTDIREHAFYNCTALKKAVFGSVSDVADRVFDGCTALTTVDFHKNVTFGSYSFQLCSALKALILRSTTLCEISSATVLEDSGIANGNGYVYVPAALVDAYKAHSAWGQYASQIRAIEDYPEVCDPYSWEAVSKHIENGTYKSAYKIGDTVPLDLGSEGVINMQIAAFDADTLADGSGTAAISWVAKELLANRKSMNPALSGTTEGTGTIGGWEKCDARNSIMPALLAVFPSGLNSILAEVLKTHDAFNTSGSSFVQTTSDKLWIPALEEVYDSGGIYTGLFKDNASRVKKTTGTTSAVAWWLRTASSTSSFRLISTRGSRDSVGAQATYGVCLGFCTGKTPT